MANNNIIIRVESHKYECVFKFIELLCKHRKIGLALRILENIKNPRYVDKAENEIYKITVQEGLESLSDQSAYSLILPTYLRYILQLDQNAELENKHSESKKKSVNYR